MPCLSSFEVLFDFIDIYVKIFTYLLSAHYGPASVLGTLFNSHNNSLRELVFFLYYT